MQRQRILIAGGGPAALECALALRALGGNQLHVELLSPDPAFVYRPLTVQDPFRAERQPPLEIAEIARARGFGFRRGRLTRFDPDRRVVETADRTERRYDSLVLAVGARPLPAVPGALTLSGSGWRDQLTELLMRVNLGTVDSLAFIVPPGVVWPLPAYELALLTAEQLRGRSAERATIAVVTSEHDPLGSFGAAGAALVSELLAASGVELHLDAAAERVEDGRLLLHGGASIAAQAAFSLPRLEGPFLADTPHDTSGFIRITPRCEVCGLDDVYAAGDATDFPIKQGDVGMQQAGLIAEQVVAKLNGETAPADFVPELRAVLLTSLGTHSLAVRMNAAPTHRGLLSIARGPDAKLTSRYLGAYLASRETARATTATQQPAPRAAG